RREKVMKRKQMMKVISTVLSATVALTLAGCGGGETEQNADGGSQENGGTVKIMASGTGGKDDEDMKLYEDALSEAVGLDVEIEKPASDDDQVLMQKLSGGEKYDLIYVSASQYKSLIEQDALMDITDRVKESEILSNN